MPARHTAARDTGEPGRWWRRRRASAAFRRRVAKMRDQSAMLLATHPPWYRRAARTPPRYFAPGKQSRGRGQECAELPGSEIPSATRRAMRPGTPPIMLVYGLAALPAVRPKPNSLYDLAAEECCPAHASDRVVGYKALKTVARPPVRGGPSRTGRR